jgi:hypothetical protein
MRRTAAALVALVAAIALTALAAPAWAAKPKPKAKPKGLMISPTEVRAGQMMTVSGGCKGSGALVFSIDSREFHRGYTKRGKFSYDVKLPRGLKAGSHRLGAQCRGSKHTPARFTVKDKKRGWDWDEGCEEDGYGNEDEEDGYEANVAYKEDCEDDEKKHRRRAWFNVSPDVVTAGDKVWAEGAGCKRYSLVIIKLDRRFIRWTFADRYGTFDKGVRLPRRLRKGRHLFSAKCGGRFIGHDGIKVKPKYSQHHDGMHSYSSVVEAGKKLRVRGDDCPDGRPTAMLDRTPLALKVVSKKKGFEAEARIPRGTAPGKHKLYAGCDAGSSGTTALNVLDPDDIKSAAATRPGYGPQPPSELALWAGLFAGLAVLVASVLLTTRRRSRRG